MKGFFLAFTAFIMAVISTQAVAAGKTIICPALKPTIMVKVLL